MGVVVFGSINLDLTVRVPALPRPGETSLGERVDMAPGGKGANQAVAARRASGDPVRLVGRVGEDAFAAAALRQLKDDGVDLTHVMPGAAPTGIAMIAVASDGANQIVVANGANATLSPDDLPEEWLTPETTLVLQMEVPAAANYAVVGRAAARGCRIVLNAAPAGPLPSELIDRLDVLVANEHEIVAVGRAAGLPADTPVMAARSLAAGRKLAVVVTLGDAGSIAFHGTQGWLVPTLKLRPESVVDTTGAGDAFVGVLAAGLDGGLTFDAALTGASVAGACACVKHGAQGAMPYADEISVGLPHLVPIERVDYSVPEPSEATAAG